MSPAAGSAPKICVRCGQDCSGKPRTKDTQGRYTCRPCLDAAQAKPVAPAPPAPTEVLPPDASADDALPPGILELAPEGPVGLQVCPGCGSSMPHGAPLCIQCGYDARKGSRLATDKSAVPEVRPPRRGKCPKCGYSLKGLKDPRCPECGTTIGREMERERRKRESAETVMWAYLKPVIQFVVGIGGMAIFFAATGHPLLICAKLLQYAIEVPVGVLVFLACCAIWIGFDAPIHLTALRLAGIFAVVDLVALLAGLLPLFLISNAIIVLAYVGMLAESLDLEIQDAIIVGILMFAATFFVVIALLAALQP